MTTTAMVLVPSDPQDDDAISADELALHTWPDGYYNDTVCEGYTQWVEKTKTNMLETIHVVKPNGKLACNCEVNPAACFNYPHVRLPSDYVGLLCPESELYLRKVAYAQQKGSDN